MLDPALDMLRAASNSLGNSFLCAFNPENMISEIRGNSLLHMYIVVA